MNLADAHIHELQCQNRDLREQIKLLSAIVEEIPGIIVGARLDAREGKQTKYDYNRAHKALHPRSEVDEAIESIKSDAQIT